MAANQTTPPNNITPSQARQNFRLGQHYCQPTSGMCHGYLQANVAILDGSLADDFKKFCYINKAPMPLLYMSKAGEYAAPTLAESSDIRTDLPAYKVYKNGVFNNNPCKDLKDFDCNNLVTFYIGCSFSFECRLLEAKVPIRNIEQGKNVSMYKTNIHCMIAGPFFSPMVVSMRPIPRGLLETAVNATLQMDFAHGAPIHIGNPNHIGINLSIPDYGDSVVSEDGDIPTFWACGVTCNLAVQSAKLPIVFSHYPGSMFISDKTVEEAPKFLQTKTYPESNVICLNEEFQVYTLISPKARNKISKIETFIREDLGHRGVDNIYVPDDFQLAALSISQDAKSVAIVTGFPCLMNCDPMEENDGIAGAINIAKAVQALGRPVTFIVDQRSQDLFKNILCWCHENGILKHNVFVTSISQKPGDNGVDQLLSDEITNLPRFSHLISIERPGRNSKDIYCTMRAIDISHHCDPIDELFIKAHTHPEIVTIGIGDGGNEIGMGKVLANVQKHITNGEEIATVVATNYLITAGVSNWGGYGLAVAIYCAMSCPVHERYRRKGIGLVKEVDLNDFVTTIEQEEKLQKYLISKGIRDGVSAELHMTVDGLDFYQIHTKKYEDIRSVATI